MPTAIEFFKLLPKTNCKDCGQPTCLAFAMLLSNQKASIEDCPHVQQEAKETLAEASAPPVKTVKVGNITMGGETVLYRHERRFDNPIAYAISISDNIGEDAIKERIAHVKSLSFDRIGMIFKVDLISVKCASSDPNTYAAAVKLICSEWEDGIVLETDNTDCIKAAMEICKDRLPLIYGADDGNVDALVPLAKEYGCALGLICKDMDNAVDLVKKGESLGYSNFILDLSPKNINECLERHTIARRAAIKKKFKPLGYPLMNRVGYGEYAVSTAVISTLKYGSLVIFDDLKSYEALPLFTLRQNIYTDPQVPIQVKQDLYPIGNPDEHSPIMFTTNFSLTYFTVRADIEKSKIPVWLQIVNTEGLSVLTAYSAGKFEPERIVEAFEESGVLNKTDGPVIIPGLVTRMSGKLQEMINRKVIVGTNESRDIPKHLREITSE